MRFSIETFDYKKSKLVLSNPQRQKIGLISDVRELSVKPYANSLTEMTFKLYKESNGIKNKYYNRLVIDKLILVKGLAWFQVKKVSVKQDEKSKIQYKEITCLTAENDLIYRKIDNVVGVYSLYDISDIEHSLLHIVQQYSGWTVGHVDLALLNKWRTLNIDSEKIYNMLTTTIATSFSCIFEFDTFNKTINAYELSNFGEMTNIIISDKNILQSYVQESDLDKVVTKMRIKGGLNSDGTQFDIRAVNPTGMDYITDFSYYMTTEWMSQSLIDALTVYNVKYDNYKTQYSNTLSLIKQYNADLTTLNSQLTDINAQIKAQEQVIGVSSQNHNGNVPISTDADYTIYQNAITQLSLLNSQKSTKQAEITAKETQISTTQSILDNISVDLSMSSNFTANQLSELDCFVKEADDYEDSTFVATDTMTKEEIIELQLELMNNGMNELRKCSRPQYTITTTISNLFTIQDGKDSVISFESWKKQFVTGNLITLKFRDNYHITVRLMSMNINCDDAANIDVTFSDKNRLDDELVQLAEIIAQADRATSAYTLKTMGYDAAARQTSAFLDFKNGTLNATNNQMISDDNAQVSIDRYGIHIREWEEDRNDFSPYQMWLNPYRMLFSNDGFKSANSAFGQLITPTGEKVMGINTDLFIGKIMMSENVYIENQSGTYKFDLNGFNATSTLNGNTYSVGIVPNTPSSIFKIAVNGSNKLYVDTVNNRLVMNGEINATSGTLGNLTVSGTLTGGTIYGTTVSASTINGTTINSATINGGDINGAKFTTTGSTYSTVITDGYIDTTYIRLSSGSTTTSITPNSTTITASSGSVGITPTRISITNGSQTSSIEPSNIVTPYISSPSGDISNFTSNYINVTTANISSLNSDSHTHYTSQITPVDTGYGNIDFAGSLNAASVEYVQTHFEPISTSDFRLKKEIQDINDDIISFVYSIKTKAYKFKDSDDKIHFGILAQEMEHNLISNCGSLNYAITDTMKPRLDTNEGFYVGEELHRIDYKELITPCIYIIQQQKKLIDDLYVRVGKLENIL